MPLILPTDRDNVLLAFLVNLSFHHRSSQVKDKTGAPIWASYNSDPPTMPSDTSHNGLNSIEQLPSPPLSPLALPAIIVDEVEDGKHDGMGIKWDDDETMSTLPSLSSSTIPSVAFELELEDNDDGSSLPIVPIETHTSNDQVFMTGVVSFPDDVTVQPDDFEDDNIHCKLSLVFEMMLYKVIRRAELVKLDLGLEDNSVLQRAPGPFATTYLGIQLALAEWTALKASREGDEAFEDHDWDDEFLCALGRRSGFAPEPGQQVIYPEEIIPFEHLQEKEGGWEWNYTTEVWDIDYWFKLKAQGEVWNEMPEIPDFRR